MDTGSLQKSFSFGSMQISGNTVIGTLNEGVEANSALLTPASEWALAHFDGALWAYISNRVNSYSIDPLIYHHIGRLNGLRGIALVCSNEQQTRNSSVEKLYCRDIPMQHFMDLEQAIEWCNSIINNALKPSGDNNTIQTRG